VLLVADGGLELLVDGDGRFTFHLGVEVPQVGGALSVVEKAIEVQGEDAGDPQTASDEDECDQPRGVVCP